MDRVWGPCPLLGEEFAPKTWVPRIYDLIDFGDTVLLRGTSYAVQTSGASQKWHALNVNSALGRGVCVSESLDSPLALCLPARYVSCRELAVGSIFRGRVVSRAHRIISVLTVLCAALANAGVLHAVHMRQHSTCGNGSDTSRPGGKHHSGNHHDPDTCPFCIQCASGKTVPAHFAEHVTWIAGPTEERVSFGTFLLPSVSLSSLPARAPPLFC
jgi:hypothetical protein